MANRPLPTPDELRQLLRYEPDTGKLYWRTVGVEHFAATRGRTAAHTCANWNGKYAGREALTAIGASGHLRGNVRGRGILAHRVAWALYYGEWPANYIDHIDMNPANNAISNLRAATKRENGCNRRATGKSKYLGVCWHKGARKWAAALSKYNKPIYLGLFEGEADAAAAYDAAARRIHGEFARLNFPTD